MSRRVLIIASSQGLQPIVIRAPAGKNYGPEMNLFVDHSSSFRWSACAPGSGVPLACGAASSLIGPTSPPSLKGTPRLEEKPYLGSGARSFLKELSRDHRLVSLGIAGSVEQR